jgi:transposase
MERDRFDHSVDHNDITKPVGRQRIEVITGPERRRKWSAEEKLSIVLESMAEGAVVSEVARRHGISPQQLFGWRSKVRAEMIAAEEAVGQPMFAPALVDATVVQSSPPFKPPAPSDDMPSIEISIGPATVRIRGAADARTLATVLKALKVLA